MRRPEAETRLEKRNKHLQDSQEDSSQDKGPIEQETIEKEASISHKTPRTRFTSHSTTLVDISQSPHLLVSTLFVPSRRLEGGQKLLIRSTTHLPAGFGVPD